MRKLVLTVLVSFFLVSVFTVPQASADQTTLVNRINTTYAAMDQAWSDAQAPGASEATKTAAVKKIASYYTADGILYSPGGVHLNDISVPSPDGGTESEIAATFRALIGAGYKFELEPGHSTPNESICEDTRRREQHVQHLFPLDHYAWWSGVEMATDFGCYRLSGNGLDTIQGTYLVIWKFSEENGSRRWRIDRDVLN